MMSARDNRSWSDPAAAMPAARLGADLRAARESLGWTLPAIAAHLRIRLPFLEAIEDGRTDDLPGNAYAVGFIRTYALALGLDADEAARRFRAEAGEVSRRTELDFPAPVPDRGVPVLAVVLVGAVLVVGAYAGWYRLSGSSHPAADSVQQVPPRLVPLVADRAPAIPIAPPVPIPATPSLATSAPPGSAQLATGPAPAPVETAQPSISPSSAAAATTEPPPAMPVADAPPPDTVAGIVLRATADSWMQVRDRGGQVLLNRVLRAGESWPVPSGRSGLLLTTGNAGGTLMVVNGVASAPLGGDGAVRRDLPLDPTVGTHAKLAAITAPGGRKIVLPHNQ